MLWIPTFPIGNFLETPKGEEKKKKMKVKEIRLINDGICHATTYDSSSSMLFCCEFSPSSGAKWLGQVAVGVFKCYRDEKGAGGLSGGR